jgi:hypothetical protein
MRSWSSRCAIEITLTRGPAVFGVEQAIDVERFAFEPGAESRRGEQLVDLHGERESVLRREERFEIDDTDLCDRRGLDLGDERREIEIAAGAPALAEERRDERVFAAAHRLGVNARRASGRSSPPC